MSDRDGRNRITAEEFYSSLDSSLDGDVRSVIDNLIKWSADNNLTDLFTTGERVPAFTPKMPRPEKPSWTFYVQADGWIVVPIRWMNDRLPFSDPIKAEELVNRLEDMLGAVLTNKANHGFPKFPIASLTSPDQYGQFIETLSWLLDELTEADNGRSIAERSIWVFGNSDTSELGFPSDNDLIEYIKGGIFSGERGRYRHTLIRDADIIVISRRGEAYGHFQVKRREKPSDADIAEFPPSKSVYLIRSSNLYRQRVTLAELSITKMRFGRKLTESEFQDLLNRAGGIQEYRNISPYAEEVSAPNKYFEGAVRTITVNAYERNPNARWACLQHHGYNCAVCGFSMADLYGDIGDTVIHVHHLRQLSSVGQQYEVDPVRDLRPVCPNCHAILHTDSPTMTIEDLQSILSTRKPIQ